MKVAHIITSLAYKGQVVVVQSIINSLINEENIEIDLYYFDDIVELDVKSNKQKIGMYKSIDFSKYDIIHSHNLRSDLYVRLFKPRHSKCKWVSTAHQIQEEDIKLRFRNNRVARFLYTNTYYSNLKKCDHLVVLTNYMKTHFDKKLPQVPKNIIWNGLDYNSDNKSETDNVINTISLLKSKYIVLGCACNISYGKALAQVIDLLVAKNDIVYILFGNGPYLSSLKDKARTEGVEDRIIFWGEIPNASQYFHLFDIYLFTSYSEGVPLALIEAAQKKLPILCSDLPMIREVYSDDEICYFENDNTKSLLDNLNNILFYKEKFSVNIYQKYLEHLTAKSMAMKYYKLYQQLLSKA